MESVSFDTLTFDHPAGRRPARLTAMLCLPESGARRSPCMVILTSSAGVQRHREHYYARALNDAGAAALIIDSFTGRGVRRTVADQTLVSAAQMEGDAFAALAVLRADPRIDPERIGVMGVSKGGVATLNAAIAVRQRWRNGFPHLFDLHIAICPGATAQHRDATTHGRPMFFMLAARDDYTPAPLAIEYAERMRSAGNDRIKVKVYGAAHHGWESVGPVFDIRDAENWSCCRNFIEDDGTHFVAAAGRAMSEPEYQAWARRHCVTRGARGRRHARAETACDGGFACLPAGPRLRASMDESGDSGYTSCVIRLRFLAVVLAFVVPVLGSSPSSANDPLWVGSSAAKARAEALLKAIQGASDHGLDPDWYRVHEVETALAPGADPVATEALLTAAFVAYASDVSTGRVRANQVDQDIDIRQRKVEPADLLKAAAAADDFSAYLASLPPKGDYPMLQKALAAWRDKRARATFTPLPDGIALRPGMIDPRVPILRKRLAELDLVVPDAGAVADLYDEPLADVVKAYQETKGLTVDGVIGAKTMQSLNTTIDERIEQIVANLERRRWLPEDLGRRYVFVNAGDYSMRFVDHGKLAFRSLVIVGRPKDPTPEIQSTMRGFQTNPYWTVPQSISGEEYLPLLRRDPNALAAAGFRIFDSWSDDTELDPNTVDWSSIHAKAFPFRIRQDPGANNALGYIFFPFPNKYGIYMHDTANRWLFTEGSRNFSHGCIRLQNPLDFVEKVFNGRNGFSKERVRQVIDAGDQAHYTFPEPVTLYVTYRTVTAGSDGAVVFRDDVYGRDRRVVRAMAKPRS